MSIETETKRFFAVDDSGASYTVVATSAEHARQILLDAGLEFTNDDGDSVPIDDPEFDDLVWSEISADRAAEIRIDDDGTQRPLAECAIGDWFSSEY